MLKVAVLAPIMEDVKAFLERKDIPVLNRYIAEASAEDVKKGLPEISPISEDGTTDPKQNDAQWYRPFSRFLRAYPEAFSQKRTPGGTGYNTIKDMKTFAGRRASELEFVEVPVATKVSEGILLIHPVSGKALQAACRPEGDIPYDKLDPKEGLGKQLKESDVILLSKSMTKYNPVGANNILDFVEKHNKKAVIIALMNGSDVPTHPEILFRASKFVCTKAELLGRPQYAPYLKALFESNDPKKADYEFLIMNGDNGEDGFDILTKHDHQHINPKPTMFKDTSGIRDGIAAFYVNTVSGVFDYSFFSAYSTNLLKEILPDISKRIAEIKSTSLPDACLTKIVETHDNDLAEKARNDQAAERFRCDLLKNCISSPVS